MATFADTARGGRKLVYNGYAYVEHRKTKRRGLRWLCESKCKHACKAFAYTSADVVDGGPVQECGQHTHCSDDAKMEVLKAKNELKRKADDIINGRAATEHEVTSKRIVSEVISGVSAGAVAGLPQVKSLQRLVRRWLTKSNNNNNNDDKDDDGDQIPKAANSTTTNDPPVVRHYHHNHRNVVNSGGVVVVAEGQQQQRFVDEHHPHSPPTTTTVTTTTTIPEELKRTLDGEDFLLCEEDFGDCHVTIYATAKNIELLRASPTWYVDWSFRSTSKIYRRLHTVHGFIGGGGGGGGGRGETVPLVYAFLNKQRKEAYKGLFSLLWRGHRQDGPAPRMIVMDCDKPAMNAAIETFGVSTAVRVCFRSLLRDVETRIRFCGGVGLQERYENERSFNHSLKMIPALAFVPSHLVINYYMQLESHVESSLIPILRYFGANYIGIDPNGKKVAAKYPVAVWTRYAAIVNDGESFCNHFLEDWRKRFKHDLLIDDRPALATVLSAIRRDYAVQQARIDRLATGFPSTAAVQLAPECVEVDEKLKKVCELFSILPFTSYLQGVAHNLCNLCV